MDPQPKKKMIAPETEVFRGANSVSFDFVKSIVFIIFTYG
jgi:hypothetical protein